MVPYTFGVNNMKTLNAMFMVYLYMYSSLFLKQALMRSVIPLIKLSSVSTPMHDHAALRFLVSMSSDVAGTI